ncbi:MAG TPA: DUF3653 domain-containing protein [Steroidobacteraceae bacterium]|nr:DUF3653 domain-containing protein [Steroidobacteraceae bacterium]
MDTPFWTPAGYAGRLGVSDTTLRRWKRTRRLPRWAEILITILSGDLSPVDPAFAGWHLRRGELVSPEGWCFTAGEIRSIPLLHGQVREWRGRALAAERELERLSNTPPRPPCSMVRKISIAPQPSQETVMKTLAVMLTLALSLSACALAPRQIAVYGEHVSHSTQHFTDTATNYGYDTVNVAAQWRTADGAGPFMDIAEGVNVDSAWHYAGYDVHGALIGPREVFSARLGWIFRLR